MASAGELLEAINYVPMIWDEFVRLVVNIKKRGVHNFTRPFLEDRLAALEKWLNVLHKTHVKIATHTKPAELAKMEYVTDSWYQAALDAHSDAEEFILGHLDELRPNQGMSASGPTAPSGEINHIRLPVIDLPKFSGDYLEWNNFYETFSSIDHDKVYVSGRDKFHYLKSCLQGEAATVIKSLAITSENYEIAWDTLVARYTDKRMITDTFLDQISQVPTLRGDNFKVLKEVRDSVTVALNALKTMGYGVDQWDPIIVHSLKNKLDDTLRLAWEMYLGSSKDYPSFIQFSEFLTRHINSLQSLGNKPKTSKRDTGRSLKSHATSVNSTGCAHCGSNHLLKCSKMHHTLLHFDKSGTGGSKARGSTPVVNSSSAPEPSSSNTTTHLSVSYTRSVLLAIFSARIDAHDGSRIIVRGLVDTGSETSFISENLAKQLRVSRKRVNATIHGVSLNSAQNVRAETENQKTKIRVVFNASSKTSTGVSLNDTLFIGPKLQQDITRILMNWRSFRYVGVTDIVKMFRQILAFELNTVTYGTGPAPFLSSRVLRELAYTNGANFPLSQDVLLNSTYVDDILFGAHDLKQLKIPEPIQSKWLKCYEQLRDLQTLRIPRWTGQSLTTGKRKLIGFCDASELAYGAVVYERLTDEDGQLSVHLVMSKTKVAPIKTTSIPRLELVAAALFVKLLVHVKGSLVGSCDAIRWYSDSQVALAWIAKQPVHWKTFVANRVSYIQTHLSEASWHYVPTKSNPADLCSRGTSAQQLSEDSLWWHGPAFLREHTVNPVQIFETAEESRKVALTAQMDKAQCWFFDKFSSGS
ncbi:uncharacterized protein [Prorops nasuta]|uniref:uncharacterized protein n=1 Tax=Prorops nasuta TaxID=863751 RepID=UPI0034CDA8D6